jgi:hypothetical protein
LEALQPSENLLLRDLMRWYQKIFPSVACGTANHDRCHGQLRYHDLVFSCLLAVTFLALVPVVEWPDALDHIARRVAQQTYYPPDIFSIYASLPVPALNGEHIFFGDHYMYRPLVAYFGVNLERLPIVVMAILGLYWLASKVEKAHLLFCPPIIYAWAGPSQEAVAIFLLVVAVVIWHKHEVVAALLALLSLLIDRSMAPSAAFFLLYAALPSFRAMVLNVRVMMVIGALLIVGANLISPLDLIGAADNKTKLILGLTVEDVRDSAQHGGRKYLALAASTMGLYGWMSIRPFPFWIYYPVITLLFVVGFLTSQRAQQSLFIALLALTGLVLWLMPTLSQARYYPLLALSFWGMVISGAQAARIKPAAVFAFVIAGSAAGCLASLLRVM